MYNSFLHQFSLLLIMLFFKEMYHMSVRIHPHESHGAFVNRYVITTDIQIFFYKVEDKQRL